MPRRKRPEKGYLVRLLSEGKQAKDIAAIFDVIPRTIYKWFRCYDIAAPRLQAPPREELFTLYITRKWSMGRIAQRHNVSYPTARRWLMNYGIEIRTRITRRPSREVVYDLYCVRAKSTTEIALLHNVCAGTVGKWLAHYGIPSRHSLISRPDKEQLTQWYWNEEWTLLQIAEHCKVTHPAVRGWLVKFNIPRRSNSEAQCVLRGTQALTKGLLTDLYHEKGLSQAEIGERFGITQAAIKTKMKNFGIPTRTKSENLKGEKNPMFGRTHTPAARAKIREANRRQFSTQEARDRHAILTAKQIEAGRTGKTHNKLETAFAAILDGLDIVYIWQYRISKFVYDFYIPATNTPIETHGTFWHADPRFYLQSNLCNIQQKNAINDKRKARLARNSGYSFLHLWEHDIHNNPQKVISILAAHSIMSACTTL